MPVACATMAAAVIVLTLTPTAQATSHGPEGVAPAAWGHALFILTFPAAGIAYSASGWVGKIRRSLGGAPAPPLEWRKMGKAVALGCLLGTAAYFYVLYDGDSGGAGTITDERAFVAQVMANTGAIVFADKLLLGRGRAGDTGSKHPVGNSPATPSGASGLDVLAELNDIQDEEAPPPSREALP